LFIFEFNALFKPPNIEGVTNYQYLPAIASPQFNSYRSPTDRKRKVILTEAAFDQTKTGTLIS